MSDDQDWDSDPEISELQKKAEKLSLTERGEIDKEIIRKLKAKSRKQKGIIQKQAEENQQKDKSIQQKDKTIQQKDKSIQQKDETIQQKDKSIQQKDETIQEQGKIIDEQADKGSLLPFFSSFLHFFTSARCLDFYTLVLPELDPSTQTTDPSISTKHDEAEILEDKRRPFSDIEERIPVTTQPFYRAFHLEKPSDKLTVGSEANLTTYIATYVRAPLPGLKIGLECVVDQFLVSLKPDILVLFKKPCKHLPFCYCFLFLHVSF